MPSFRTPFGEKLLDEWNTSTKTTKFGAIICISQVDKWCRTFRSFCLKWENFAEISRKFSTVCWFNKSEDCIFPSSFILRFNVQSFNLLPSFNLAIVSQSIHNLSRSPFTIFLVVLSQSITFTELFLFIYPFRKYTPLCVYLRFPQSLSCTLQVHCTH